jgi:protein-glutamine gamma-glutamyltransferase
VNTVLTRFRKQAYSYTLSPPALGRNSVDEFLYRTRAGFCEHYASSFVFLMRAAGVPARVVTGYQGGEINPVDGFLVVRQSDAHAWAEVWIAKRGWVRVDPTAAVSPDRVERNLARALPPDGVLGTLIDLGLSRNSWLNELQFQLSAINNGWNQWVLSYDPKRQTDMLNKVIAALSNWRYLAALASLLALAYLVHKRRLRAQTDPVDTLYFALCQQLAALGLVRAADEGPNAYALRLADMPLAPHKKDAALRFLALYSAYKYAAQAAQRDLVPTLKKLLSTTQ